MHDLSKYIIHQFKITGATANVSVCDLLYGRWRHAIQQNELTAIQMSSFSLLMWKRHRHTRKTDGLSQ